MAYEAWQNGDGSGLQENVKENTDLVYNKDGEKWKNNEKSPILPDLTLHRVIDGGRIILDREETKK